ncbi:MAG TPA: hypothetical protein VFI56_12385 [Vicinamibacterales bacterium]|jgi:hypothetical protein|nr:hypothetical protein [Vicinamibacterales bacterium]
MLWMATGTWRQIRELHKPRATAVPVVRMPSALRHPIAAVVTMLLELRFASTEHRRAKIRA